MENRVRVIKSIVILSCLALGVLVLMIFLMNNNEGLWFSDSEVLFMQEYKLEDIKKIKSNLASYDLTIKSSDNERIKIEVYGQNKDKNKVQVKVNLQEMRIEQQGASVCFGFCFNRHQEVVLYIPTNFKEEIDLETKSGDITSQVELDNKKVNILTTSGDILVSSLNNASVRSVSGEIKISKATNLKAQTTSGDIYVGTLDDYADIKTTSGSVELKKMVGYAKIESTSGDIEIDDLTLTRDSEVKSTSGEIDIKLRNGAQVEAQSVSGDKEINVFKGEYKLSLKTVSGDIEVETKYN